MDNLLAQDVLNIMDPIARAAQMALERDSARRAVKEPPVLEQYDPTVQREPLVIPKKNMLTDPESKLNRGLGNLVDNTVSMLFGEESGHPVVDYGTANLPGIGAASILVAGGMPGLLDVAGMGELKNLAKIPKYTLEFVGKHFGETGLKNLDNALSMYPKAGKPSVNDALYVMRSGIGGERVQAIAPYTSDNVVDDAISLVFDNTPDEIRNQLGKWASDQTLDYNHTSLAKDVLDMMDKAEDTGDMTLALRATHMFDAMDRGKSIQSVRKLENMPADDMYKETMRIAKDSYDEFPDTYQKARTYRERATTPLQDWDKIIERQERKDAEKAVKAERNVQKEIKPAKAPKKTIKKQVDEIVQESPSAPPPEVVVQEAPKVETGPTKWRENGWNSKQYDPNFFGKFGSRMDEESKRDLFVVDSLAKHWAGQLKDRGLSAKKILTGLDRASARHTATNYDEVSNEFLRDIVDNIESGNMPGTAVKWGQKYKRNHAVPNMSTPTLILRTNERPNVRNWDTNVRVWADEAEGPDLYEVLFRPLIDRKIHGFNPDY